MKEKYMYLILLFFSHTTDKWSFTLSAWAPFVEQHVQWSKNDDRSVIFIIGTLQLERQCGEKNPENNILGFLKNL